MAKMKFAWKIYIHLSYFTLKINKTDTIPKKNKNKIF